MRRRLFLSGGRKGEILGKDGVEEKQIDGESSEEEVEEGDEVERTAKPLDCEEKGWNASEGIDGVNRRDEGQEDSSVGE